MALLTTISGVPLFTTTQEALSWANDNNCNGYHEHDYDGQTGYMGCADHSQASSSPINSNLTLNIPSQSSETIYHVFFESIGSTSYSSHLPTQDSPWVINQLVNPTLTIKFRDTDGYVSEKTTTKKHFPGVVLNSGSIDNAKIPINITTIPLRGGISIKNSIVKTENITAVDSSTIVVSSNLTASVSGRTGSITGTITIGESSKRDSDVLFNPDDFFTIT